jgi:hypothetical protein
VCVVLTGGLATLLWSLNQRHSGPAEQQLQGQGQQAGMPLQDAVIVFGSTGKLGRQIVAQVSSAMSCLPCHWICMQARMPLTPCCALLVQLLSSGRNVVAAARDAGKGAEIFGELGLKEGPQSSASTVRLQPFARDFAISPSLDSNALHVLWTAAVHRVQTQPVVGMRRVPPSCGSHENAPPCHGMD